MGPMGPMGPMGMRPPMRQGTSHMVPIVVSAGLAVGVFCGLLFGLGTGKHDAEPSRASNGVKRTEDTAPDVPTLSTNTLKPVAPKAAVAAGSGSGGGSAAAAGAASAVPPPGKLTIDVKPDAIAASVKILIDGKQVAPGTTSEIPFEAGVKEKIVKVVVQAPGYQEVKREDPVESGGSTSVSIELVKSGRSAATAGADGSGAPAGASAGNAGDGGRGKTDDGGKATGSKTDGGGKTDSGRGKTDDGNKSNGKGKGKGSGKSGLIDI
jgi:hypothetical protein